MVYVKKGITPLLGKTLKYKNPKILKKIAIAFAIVIVAVGLYIQFLAPHTLEAKQRVKLESTQHQLIETRNLLEKSKTTTTKQIDELNKKLKDTERQLQAKRQANTAVASPVTTYALPEDEAKAFIYQHESGNNPGAINASSGACGLGQALPCSKMGCSLSDYGCQDAWFTQYMRDRYGSWSNAVAFWQSHNWW